MNLAGRNSLLDSDKAKRYSNLKYGSSIIETFYSLVINLVFLISGLSFGLSRASSSFLNTSNIYLILPFYLAVILLAFYILNFSLEFYQTFLLEHQFGLSRQTIKEWFKDQLKSGIVAYIISLICLEALYFVLALSPKFWWLVLSVFFIFFNVIMANLAPVVILPLFFKYKQLSNEKLSERIKALAGKMQVKIKDIFEIDFSKKTVKANAGLMGLGKTRRVVLADTLQEKYTDEEIEVIMAHEFAHHKLKHMFKLILISSGLTFIYLYLMFVSSGYFLAKLHIASLSDLAALPLFFIYLVVISLVLKPGLNFLSCKFENDADLMALKATGLKEPFISMMEKLAAQNLSDRSPHFLIKMFFFDHPPVDERIATAQKFNS